MPVGPARSRRDLWLVLPRSVRVLARRLRMKLDPYLGFIPLRASDTVHAPWFVAVVRRLPTLPPRLRRIRPAAIWTEAVSDTPEQLRTVAGIWRNSDAEVEAFRERPVYSYFALFPENLPSVLAHGWHFWSPAAPGIVKSRCRAQRLSTVRARRRVARPGPVAESSPDRELTSRLRQKAAAIGLSAVGFVAYDPKYTFADFAGSHDEGSVIVCVFEQDWAATQTAPSARAERAAFSAYAGLMERTVELAEFVEAQGHRAYAHSFTGETMTLHYAVEAGLGQLGLNGQLLTPAAGSRARITVITTDTSLEHDHPVDFGIHKICDECQACVRQCPVGAIPKRRREHRGVLKAKIKTERCFPVVATAEGCGVCMKVCPIQRWGLEAVKRHLVETGSVLGVGTAELEEYVWPLDGRRYGSGEKPDAESRREALRPPGWHPIDPDRKLPPHEGASQVKLDLRRNK